MDTLFEIISKPWIGTIIGLVGVVLAIFFYFRSRRISKLMCQHESVELIGSTNASFPNEVEIFFAGRSVPRVTKERVIIWNAGNTTILGHDITASDPLRIELDGGEILSFYKLKDTRAVNNIVLAQRDDAPNILDVKFDYFDPGDGVAFEVIHSGDSRSSFHLLGTIRGIQNRIRSLGGTLSLRRYRLGIPLRVVAPVTIVYGAVVAVLGFVLPHLITKSESLIVPGRTLWLFVILGLITACTAAVFLWSQRRRYPAALSIDNASGLPMDKESSPAG